jgi:hypothetical protein
MASMPSGHSALMSWTEAAGKSLVSLAGASSPSGRWVAGLWINLWGTRGFSRQKLFVPADETRLAPGRPGLATQFGPDEAGEQCAA